MSGSVIESMRLLGQLSHALDNIAGKGIPLQEPMVTITMSEYEKLKSGKPSMEDIHAATMANLAIIRENHLHNAEMIRLQKRNAELQEENGRLRQELEKLKNRKKWRIFK